MNKSLLLDHLKTLLGERMMVAWSAMEAAQDSANDQGKSSAGDKYETSRSMGQLDRNMHARQYEQARQERLVLEKITGSEVPGKSTLGTLLQTTAGWFFIAVSLGAVEWEEERIMVVSSSSPVGASLLGKKAGDSFMFMQKQHRIEALH
ncbi:transcription elongation factor [Dyadobacter sandarakinus]|uniref:Transcription elongation factor n=1 Tax=Dyadobacter sandarakinus TaxID=2747268 RepID=A0ABX7ICH6_9BACT|nr:transcription elongation factor [Dyadobacter sandarakinus]QRR03812.1 transcription elongation factor [Dyadobacter sandarakinus]